MFKPFSHITRIPEPPVLHSDEDIIAYQKDSGRGIMKWAEEAFVCFLLKKFGNQPKLNILDVASGPGWIPVSIAKQRPNWMVTGVDPLPIMLSCAEKWAASQGTYVSWMRGHADKLDFPAEHFDLVICHFAFHEFTNPQACVNEMGRVLKKGGTLIIQDLIRPLHFEFPVAALLNRLNGYSVAMQRQYMHCAQAAFTPGELGDYFRSAGLQAKTESKYRALVRAVGVKT